MFAPVIVVAVVVVGYKLSTLPLMLLQPTTRDDKPFCAGPTLWRDVSIQDRGQLAASVQQCQSLAAKRTSSLRSFLYSFYFLFSQASFFVFQIRCNRCRRHLTHNGYRNWQQMPKNSLHKCQLVELINETLMQQSNIKKIAQRKNETTKSSIDIARGH